jgi:hypothetical protein
MVDVLDLDTLSVIISGVKVADIDCGHVIPRAALSAIDSAVCKAAKETAREHGAKVLDSATKIVCATHPAQTKFVVGGQGGEEAGQTFAAIFKDAYSVLLHQQRKSMVLRQGADTAIASLHLKVKEEAGPSLGGKKRPSQGAASPDLAVMLQTTHRSCPTSSASEARVIKGHLRLLFTFRAYNDAMTIITTCPFCSLVCMQLQILQGEAFFIPHNDRVP